MPRQQPPAGFMTAGQVIEVFKANGYPKFNYTRLKELVDEGILHRVGPTTRKYLFYLESEVYAYLESRNAFPKIGKKEINKRKHGEFMQATMEDVFAIADMDERSFNIDGEEKATTRDAYLSWLIPIYLRWFQKSPESFSVVKNKENKVVAFSIIISTRREVVSRFTQGEIAMEDILQEDLLPLEPGIPVNLYVIAIAVEPDLSQRENREMKKWYGTVLLRGILNSLAPLAERGVEIEKITARSFTTDGKKLMRSLGFTHHRSLFPKKELYSIVPSDSGIKTLMLYTDTLNRWKEQHQQEAKQAEREKETCSIVSEKMN